SSGMRQIGLAVVAVVLTLAAPRAQQSDVDLQPTNHPRLPAELSKLWIAPEHVHPAAGLSRTTALGQFAEAVKLEVESNYVRALPILSQSSVRQGTLGDYAIYYEGLAQLRLGRGSDARQTFQALQTKPPVGYLREASALREAEADEALGDQAAAL